MLGNRHAFVLDYSLVLAVVVLLLGCSCDDSSKPTQVPSATVLSEETYDEINAIGNLEATAFWGDVDTLEHDEAVDRLVDRLSAYENVDAVYQIDMGVLYEHSSGFLAGIATLDFSELAETMRPKRAERLKSSATSPNGFSMQTMHNEDQFRAKLFNFPSWFPQPPMLNPSVQNRNVLEDSGLFRPITLVDYSFSNLSELREIGEEHKIIYIFPLHGDGDVVQMTWGQLGPAVKLCDLPAYQELDEETQKDLEQGRMFFFDAWWGGGLHKELWLTNLFFEHYFIGFTEEPLILISACNLLKVSGALWSSLSAGGAAAVVGYTDYMNAGQAVSWEPYLLQRLVDGRTLADAISDLHGQYPSSDILTYDGDGSWSLCETIWPLAIGNYWTIQAVNMSPDETIGYEFSIRILHTREINGNLTYAMDIEGDIERYFMNKSDGLYFFGEKNLVTGEEIIFPNGVLYWKYPCEAGDSYSYPGHYESISVLSTSETSQVPAGSFNCIQYYCNWMDSGGYREYEWMWFAPGVGWVQTECHYEIPGYGEIIEYYELADYHVGGN